MTEVIIQACTREMMEDIVELSDQGLLIKQIAERSGFHHQTVAKYLRLHALFGLKAFIPQAILHNKEEPCQKNTSTSTPSRSRSIPSSRIPSHLTSRKGPIKWWKRPI